MGLVVLFILLALALLGWLAVSWRREHLELEIEAKENYQALQGRGGDSALALLSKSGYVTLYIRTHRIRRQKYIVAFLVLGIAGTFPTMALLSLFRKFVFFGPIFWQFQIFFTLIAWWVLAVWLTLKYYYARQPGSLEEEHERPSEKGLSFRVPKRRS